MVVQVVVVWDALGGTSTMTTQERHRGIDIVFCGDCEADTFLIQEVICCTLVTFFAPSFCCVYAAGEPDH